MKFLPLIFLFFVNLGFAQDTFSIVAVDASTGEVGGAGATCLDIDREGFSVEVINDLIPGRGAIHTQAAYNSTNQIRARLEMLGGNSPAEIIEYLETTDAQGNPQSRQYGIVDFDTNGIPRAAAFTGINCFDVKHHIVGDHYSIQGNILLDSTILDSMEAHFLRTNGSLADKLMAAMQGAKIPGADSRCLVDGVSSRSAILKVAKEDDVIGSPYIDLHIPVTPDGVDPIDALQNSYDEWKATSGAIVTDFQEVMIKLFPNPTERYITIAIPKSIKIDNLYLSIFDINGKEIFKEKVENRRVEVDLKNQNSGVYLARLKSKASVFTDSFIID